MKVTIPKKGCVKPKGSPLQPPPISMDIAVSKELTIGEYVKMKLKSNPMDVSSSEYEFSIPFFKNGSPEEWFKFLRNFDRVVKGQNLSTGPTKFAMARRLLQGAALSQFEAKAITCVTTDGNRSESKESFEACILAVTKFIRPRKALQCQKKYMRHFVKKPASMTTRQFYLRFLELNAYLEMFVRLNLTQHGKTYQVQT